jgi:hypothetical protein
MTEYSGRTTAHCHKFDDWRDKPTEGIDPAITQMTVFNAQWTDCPVEVEEEVKKLWQNHEFGNDHCYFVWDRNGDSCICLDEDAEEWSSDNYEDGKLREHYPLIDEYLMSNGVEKCLIHWWW